MQNRAKRDFVTFIRIFLKTLKSHIFPVEVPPKGMRKWNSWVAKTKGTVKLLHLVADDSFCHFSLVWKLISLLFIGVTRPYPTSASEWRNGRALAYVARGPGFDSHRGRFYGETLFKFPAIFFKLETKIL